MTFVLQPCIKTSLIIIGIIVLIAIVVFLYLLIAGADESRRYKEPTQRVEDSEEDINRIEKE